VEKNYQYVGDTNRYPFMTLPCLSKIMPLFIHLVIPEAKDTKYVQKKNCRTRQTDFRNILEHLKLPQNETIYVGSHKDAGVVSRREK